MTRRLLFYGFIASQVIVIIFLAWQFNKALGTGMEISFKTKLDEIDEEYTYDLVADYYTDFEINYIHAEEIEGELKENDFIYVLLRESDEGYKVEHAATRKINPTENGVVLKGRYKYKDHETKALFIEYGFENIKNIEDYGQFTNENQLLITLNYVKLWNQYQVKEIKQINEG